MATIFLWHATESHDDIGSIGTCNRSCLAWIVKNGNRTIDGGTVAASRPGSRDCHRVRRNPLDSVRAKINEINKNKGGELSSWVGI